MQMEMTDGVPGSPMEPEYDIVSGSLFAKCLLSHFDHFLQKGKIDMFQGMAIIDVSFRYYEKVMLCTWSNILDDIQTIILI